MNKKLNKCKGCGTELSKHATSCPQCGAKNKKPLTKRVWFWAIIAVLAIGSIGSGKDKPSTSKTASVVSGNTASTLKSTAPTTAPAATAPAATTPAATVPAATVPAATTPVETAAKVPIEYKSALTKAKVYANSMKMSKAGVFDQLTSEYGEQFNPEAAQYAIDNVQADWNANALSKAKTYSDTMKMSSAGVYDQLVSEYGEKFTADEAQYGVDNVKADWNANALAKAKTYQETMAMSPASVYDQLVSEYGEKFTADQADFAIAHLND